MNIIFEKIRHMWRSIHINKDWIIYLCATIFFPLFVWLISGVIIELIIWIIISNIRDAENPMQFVVFGFFFAIGVFESVLNLIRWRKYEREKKRKEEGQ